MPRSTTTPIVLLVKALILAAVTMINFGRSFPILKDTRNQSLYNTPDDIYQ